MFFEDLFILRTVCYICEVPYKLILSILKRFFKDTLIYGFAAVLPKAINVLLVKLHTSTLTTSEYSVNTSFYVWAAYFNIVLTYGMETAFFRFFNAEKNKEKVVATSFISVFISTLLALLVLLFFRQELASILGFSNTTYLSLLIWIAILDTLVVIPFAYLRVTGASLKYTLFRVLNISIYAFFNLLFLWFLPQSENIPELLKSIYNPLFKVKFDFDKQVFKKMLKYSWPIMVAGLAYTTNENLDKLLLESWLGKSVMGAYAGAYKISVIMSLFILAFRLGAEPFFFNQSTTKNAPKTYALILKWFVIVGAFFVLVIVCFLEYIAHLFLGNEAYFKALSIVPIILIANLFLGIYNNLSIWYKLTDKTHYGMYISIFGALVTVVLLYIFIPSNGFIGAAWATLGAYSSMTVISYLLGQKIYPVPYDLKRIGWYLFASCGFSSLSFLKFQGNFTYNILLISIFLLLTYVLERKELNRFISKQKQPN
jgi:O-antigen/teichoic acid export membrane protein